MRLLITAFLAITAISASSAVWAGELDNEGQVTNVDQRAQAANLPATLVVRITRDTNTVSILSSNASIAADSSTVADLDSSKFFSVTADQKVQTSELDRDSSTESWFYFNGFNYYHPCFYYGGYNYFYTSYFWYAYGPYYYYYYRW